MVVVSRNLTSRSTLIFLFLNAIFFVFLHFVRAALVGTTLVELFTETELLRAAIVEWDGEAVGVGVINGVLAAGCEDEVVRETVCEDDIDCKDVIFCPDPSGKLTFTLLL